MRIGSLALGVVALGLAAAVPARASIIIYQDNFNGSGTPISPQYPPSARYTVTGTVTEGGGVATLSANSTLFLPFVLASRTAGVADAPGVYEYSCDLTGNTYGGLPWFGLTISSTSTGANNLVGGMAMTNNGRNISAYGGIGESIPAGSSFVDTKVEQHHLDIVMNDTVANAWTFAFTLDGNPFGSTVTDTGGVDTNWVYGKGKVLGLIVANPSTYAIAATLDNLQLQQVVVPEPATLGLLALGGLAAFLRRHRA